MPDKQDNKNLPHSQISIRELLLITAVVALGVGWWTERRTASQQLLENDRRYFHETADYENELRDVMRENRRLKKSLEQRSD